MGNNGNFCTQNMGQIWDFLGYFEKNMEEIWDFVQTCILSSFSTSAVK